ncbi:MAG: purine-nucleoside phosphorylase [Clostridia bacterium]|nr:purine-nucleoside phosphorylase [Clostridia bacterium]
MNYQAAADFIRQRVSGVFDTCVVLGSGYGSLIDKLPQKTTISYSDIPGFPVSTVPGHKGELVFASFMGKNVVFLSGRFHFYEGYSLGEVTFYVRVLKLIGVKNLILTNATGGINPDFKAGDLVVISDHIKLGLQSPLFGPNDDSFGPRFHDMSCAYSLALREKAQKAFEALQLPYKTGVYAMMGGPQFETPAEIRALGILGADMVGMSTVPEVIVANHCGMEVLGISLISNLAAGISKAPLSHEEVMEEGRRATETFWKVLRELMQLL